MTDEYFDELNEEDDVDNSVDEREFHEHFRFVVDKGQSMIRIDKHLVNLMSGISRNRLQDAAVAGNIFVNEKPVKSNYRVKPLDVISIVLAYPPSEFEIIPQDIPIDIAYEDEDIMLINKKPGIVVHPGFGNFDGTLLNAIAWHLRDNKNFDPNDSRIGLVHRIDKDTSGLILIAKTPDAKSHLGKQFFNKTTQRRYHALVWGNVKDDEGTIIGSLARNPRDRMQFIVFPEGENPFAKHAVTHYKVLERLGYVTLVECKLETGRTHQIRVHMKHIGHTLFNDERYGGNVILKGTTSAYYKAFVKNCFFECPRQALHAKTLGFVHPRTGEFMHFDSELPDDMQTLIEMWRSYGKEHLGL
ncbi:MAG TPA: RluA family pseudouridine synthase [Paludibacter sp.]|nr:RluA family pseudouridine synthase [Paludibacter sp.]